MLHCTLQNRALSTNLSGIYTTIKEETIAGEFHVTLEEEQFIDERGKIWDKAAYIQYYSGQIENFLGMGSEESKAIKEEEKNYFNKFDDQEKGVLNFNFGAISSHSSSPISSKRARSIQYCPFCYSFVQNFSRHLSRQHSDIPMVKRINEFPPCSTKRKIAFRELSNLGKVIAKMEQNKLTPVRKSGAKVKDAQYYPCTSCLGYFTKKGLVLHRRHCSSCGDKQKSERKSTLLDEAKDLSAKVAACRSLRFFLDRSRLNDEVFAHMNLACFTAKNDALLCLFADWDLRSRQNRTQTITKLQELTEFKVTLGKITDQRDFIEYLKPEMYEVFIAALKINCNYNSFTKSFGKANLAVRIGMRLKRLCEIAKKAIVSKHMVFPKTTCKERMHKVQQISFLSLKICKYWPKDLSKLTGAKLKSPKFKLKTSTLEVLIQNVKRLNCHFIQTYDTASKNILKGENVTENYKILAESTLCCLIMLNRQLFGPIQSLEIETYKKPVNRLEEIDSLTEFEQTLSRFYKTVFLSMDGKDTFPIFFTKQLEINVELLLRVRNDLNLESSKFVFSIDSSLDQTIDGSVVLPNFVLECGARRTLLLLSQKYVRHIAVILQLLNMEKMEFDAIRRFIGYCDEDENMYFRVKENTYELSKVVKLLLHRYSRKNTLITNQICRPIEKVRKKNQPSRRPVKIIGCKGFKKSWSLQEKSLVTEYFKDNIQRCMAPKKYQCLDFIRQNDQLFMEADWLRIKALVYNTYRNRLNPNEPLLDPLRLPKSRKRQVINDKAPNDTKKNKEHYNGFSCEMKEEIEIHEKDKEAFEEQCRIFCKDQISSQKNEESDEEFHDGMITKKDTNEENREDIDEIQSNTSLDVEIIEAHSGSEEEPLKSEQRAILTLEDSNEKSAIISFNTNSKAKRKVKFVVRKLENVNINELQRNKTWSAKERKLVLDHFGKYIKYKIPSHQNKDTDDHIYTAENENLAIQDTESDKFQDVKIKDADLIMMKEENNELEEIQNSELAMNSKKDKDLKLIQDTKINSGSNNDNVYCDKLKLKRPYKHWTKYEKELVIDYFKEHIDFNRAPKKTECLNFVLQHPKFFKESDCQRIKSLVFNTYRLNIKNPQQHFESCQNIDTVTNERYYDESASFADLLFENPPDQANLVDIGQILHSVNNTLYPDTPHIIEGTSYSNLPEESVSNLSELVTQPDIDFINMLLTQKNIPEKSKVNKSEKIKIKVKPKHKKQNHRKRWASEGKKLVLNYFKEYIKSKKQPNEEECYEFIEKYNDVFKTDDWKRIRILVYNTHRNEMVNTSDETQKISEQEDEKTRIIRFNVNDTIIENSSDTIMGNKTIKNGANRRITRSYQAANANQVNVTSVDEITDLTIPRREEKMTYTDTSEAKLSEKRPRSSIETEDFSPNKKGDAKIRKRWTDDEKKIILTYFRKNIKRKIPPRKSDCFFFALKTGGLFRASDWVKIKTLVYNTYKDAFTDLDDTDDSDDDDTAFKKLLEGYKSKIGFVDLDGSDLDEIEPIQERKYWNEFEKMLVLKYFSEHLKKKLPPKKQECFAFIKKFNQTFVEDDWVRIKTLVYNTYRYM